MLNHKANVLIVKINNKLKEKFPDKKMWHLSCMTQLSSGMAFWNGND